MSPSLADLIAIQLEKIIQLACSLPHGSPGEKKLTGELLDILWTNLKHPPLSYMGDDWRYRTADGSNNVGLSPEAPHFGSYVSHHHLPLEHSIPRLGQGRIGICPKRCAAACSPSRPSRSSLHL
jgi:hypothetical protein